MKNPYANEHDEVEVRLGRGAAWTLIFIFLLVITLPPLYRNLFELAKPKGAERWVPAVELFKAQSDEGLVAHLKAFEGELDKAAFTEPPRRVVQSALTRGPLNEGNRKTRIGDDGWLYFQTALDAMTGYGPITPEPDSVAKDPNRAPWKSPLPAITTFAAQLEEFGVELLLVPIPVKPMIYPEHFGSAADGPVTHPDAATLYSQLNALANVEVIDLASRFWELKETEQVFLKQDTHWTPAGMEFAAAQLAAQLKTKPWFEAGSASIALADADKRQSLGDLVEKLDIGSAGFAPEEVLAHPVSGETRSIDSPIVLLGDSFTNIYSSASLDWGEGAGFAEHLALQLGAPLDVIAINGGAATEVRAALANRIGSARMMKEKKVVVWTIAVRDLFLSESAARSAEVEWEDVAFNDKTRDPSQAGASRILATLVSKPEIPDPKSTSYSSLLYAAEYRIDEVLEGDIEPEDDGKIAVVHYAFENRNLYKSSAYKIGQQREFTLVPFDTMKDLQTIETRNDSDLFEVYWDTTPTKPLATASGSTPHLVASTGCAAFAIFLGVGLRRAAKK